MKIDVRPVGRTTFRGNYVITVTPIQPVVCKMCWSRRSVNTVRIGPVQEQEGQPLCQQCTNQTITKFSQRQEYLDSITAYPPDWPSGAE